MVPRRRSDRPPALGRPFSYVVDVSILATEYLRCARARAALSARGWSAPAAARRGALPRRAELAERALPPPAQPGRALRASPEPRARGSVRQRALCIYMRRAPVAASTRCSHARRRAYTLMAASTALHPRAPLTQSGIRWQQRAYKQHRHPRLLRRCSEQCSELHHATAWRVRAGSPQQQCSTSSKVHTHHTAPSCAALRCTSQRQAAVAARSTRTPRRTTAGRTAIQMGCARARAHEEVGVQHAKLDCLDTAYRCAAVAEAVHDDRAGAVPCLRAVRTVADLVCIVRAAAGSRFPRCSRGARPGLGARCAFQAGSCESDTHGAGWCEPKGVRSS